MAMRAGLLHVFLFHAVLAIHYNVTGFPSPSAEDVEQAVRRFEEEICGSPFYSWHNMTHRNIGDTIRYMQNQTIPEQRADVADDLIEYVEWIEELDALHKRMQRFVCDGEVLNERFLQVFTCEQTHGERCRHECRTEVGAEWQETDYGVRRCKWRSWGAWLSCTGHKLAEICGGSNTEFDLARFTLIESQKALVAARRDKGQSTNCDVETVAAMYKIIFMKAPEGTKDIFGP